MYEIGISYKIVEIIVLQMILLANDEIMSKNDKSCENNYEHTIDAHCKDCTIAIALSLSMRS